MGSPQPGTSRGPDSALKELFKELADENGRITSAKLRSHVVSLGLQFSDEEIREMLEIADTSGAVDYTGFVELVGENAHHFTALEMSRTDVKREITVLLTEYTIVKKQTELYNPNDEIVSAQKKNDDRLRTQPNDTSNGDKDAYVVIGSSVEEQRVTEPSEPKENQNEETADKNARNEEQTLTKKQILHKTNSKYLENKKYSAEISEASIKDVNAVASISDSKVDAENYNKNGEDDTRQSSETDDKNDNIPESSEKTINRVSSPIDEVAKANSVFTTNTENETGEHRQNRNIIKTENITLSGEMINTQASTDTENLQEESPIPADDNTPSASDVSEEQTEFVPESQQSTVVTHDKKHRKSISRVDSKKTTLLKTKTKNRLLRTKEPISQERQGGDNVYTKYQKPKAADAKPVVRKPRPKSQPWQLSTVGPEMQSSIGCEYKLAQIRLRQRIVYLMWRAVFDDARRNARRKVKS